MLPEQSKLAWCVVITLFHCTAISSTLFRVCHRARNRQMWFDDYVAIIPLVLDCVYLSLVWVSKSNGDYLQYTDGRGGSILTSFFFGFMVNLVVLWFARISLALSLARIFPPRHLARRLALVLAALYLSFFITTTGLIIGLCQGEGLAWYKINPQNCQKGSKHIPIAGIFAILSDFLADLMLFVAPSIMLRKIKLPDNQRRLIMAAFSASVLTLLSTIIFAMFWYSRVNLGPDAVLLRIMISQIETTISLIVCNVLVVTMFFYRIFRKIPNVEAADPKAEKAKVNPIVPPVVHGVGDERQNERTTIREMTNNTGVVTHLTLTEIEEYAGESNQSNLSLGSTARRNNNIPSPTRSAPILGETSFSDRSYRFFRSLPP